MDYVVAIFIASGVLIITQSLKRQLRKSLKRTVRYKLYQG